MQSWSLLIILGVVLVKWLSLLALPLVRALVGTSHPFAIGSGMSIQKLLETKKEIGRGGSHKLLGLRKAGRSENEDMFERGERTSTCIMPFQVY